MKGKKMKSVKFILICIIFVISFLNFFCNIAKQITSGIAASSEYFRVETFPTEHEIPSFGGVIFSAAPVELSFDQDFDRVWDITQAVANEVDKLSRKRISGLELIYRPIIGMKAKDGVGFIIIGDIEEESDYGKPSRTIGFRDKNYWDDKFTIKVESLGTKKSKVIVVREVAEFVPKDAYLMNYKKYDRASSSNYERWILTRIDDLLKK